VIRGLGFRRSPADTKAGRRGVLGELLGLVGFGSFLAVSFAVGVRLVALARRTRRLPELAIGLNCLLAGSFGYALLLAAESLRLLPSPQDGWASFAGVACISAGAGCVALFSRRVFRPGAWAAGAALVLLAGWLALGVWGSWVLHVEDAAGGPGVWLGRWAPNLGLLAAYAWAGAEPLRYRARLRRRARLGFGDPLVANRMLLWGAGTVAIASIALLHLAAQLAGHYELPPALVGPVSLCALAAAATQWLAFLPPRGYVQRLERAAQAPRVP
jgi:hypothetical protein